MFITLKYSSIDIGNYIDKSKTPFYDLQKADKREGEVSHRRTRDEETKREYSRKN